MLSNQENREWDLPDTGLPDAEDTADEQSVDIDLGNQAEVAEQLAEDAGVDPTPHEVDEYIALQEQVEPAD
jgi:hypothetical protein